MLCRVLLAAIAISYLICVLFLSGIQKEDLDVSLLRKLQRFNVNLDDLSDKNLEKDCLTSSDNRSIENNEGNRDSNTIPTIDGNNTPTEGFTTTSGDELTKNYFGTLDTSELKTILIFLKNKNRNREIPTLETEDVKDIKNDIKKKMKEYIVDRMLSETNANLKKIGGVEIQHNNGSSPLEGLAKFWETYMKSLQSNVTQDKEVMKPITKKIESLDIYHTTQRTVNYKEVEHIGKVLVEYLSKKHLLPISGDSQTEKPTTQPDPPQVDKLLAKSHEIEQQFASSLAAINKLNENIAHLENNLSSGKYLSTDTSKHHELIYLSTTNTPKIKEKSVQDKPIEGVAWRKTINIAEVAKPGPQGSISSEKKIQNLSNKHEIKQKEPNNNERDFKNDSDYLENDGAPVEGIGNSNYITNDIPNNVISKITQNDDSVVNINQLASTNHAQKSDYSRGHGFDKQELNKDTFNNLNDAHTMQSNTFQYEHKEKSSQDIPDYVYKKTREPNNRLIQVPAIANVVQHFQYPYNLVQQNVESTGAYAYGKYTKIVHDSLNFNKERPRDKLKDFTLHKPYNENSQEIQNYSHNRELIHLVTNDANTIPDVSQKQYLQQETAKSYDTPKISFDHGIKTHSSADGTKTTEPKYIREVDNEKKTSNYGFSKQEPQNYAPLPLLEHANQDPFYINKLNISEEEKKDVKQISLDIIKKIAESVKEIVLKDLRNVSTIAAAPVTVVSTTPMPTTVKLTTTSEATTRTIMTTPVTNTSTVIVPMITTANTIRTLNITSSTVANTSDFAPNKIDLNKVQIATQAMEKFLELFEKLKYVDVNKDLKDAMKLVPDEGTTKEKIHNAPVILLPPPLPLPDRVKGKSKFLPIIVNPFGAPNLINQRDAISGYSPVDQVPNMKHFAGEPVMIQTNANDIHPIGIQMMKPEAINVNIILTTQHPFWNKRQKNRWDFMMAYGRNPEKRLEFQNVKKNMNVYSHIQTTKNNKSDNSRLKPDNVNNIGIVENKIYNNSDNTLDDNTRLNLLKEIAVYHQEPDPNYDKINVGYTNVQNQISHRDKSNKFINQNIKTLDKYTDAPYNKNYLNPVFNHEFNNYNSSNQYTNGGFENRENEYSNNKDDTNGRPEKADTEPEAIPIHYQEEESEQKTNQMNDVNRVPVHMHDSKYKGIFNHGENIHSNAINRPYNFENTKYKDYRQTKNKENMYVIPSLKLNHFNDHIKNSKPSNGNYGSVMLIKNKDKYYSNQNMYSGAIMPSQNKDFKSSNSQVNLGSVNKYFDRQHKYATGSKPKQQHYDNDYNNVYLMGPMKSKLNSLESYLDNRNQMERLHSTGAKHRNPPENGYATDFTRVAHLNKFSQSHIPKQISKSKFNSFHGEYLSNPSEEESGLEFKPRVNKFSVTPLSKPYQKFDPNKQYKIKNSDVYNFNEQQEGNNWDGKNKDSDNNQHMEIITAMIGHRDRQKTSSDIETERERNPYSQQILPQMESSDTEAKILRPQVDSLEARQYQLLPADPKRYPNIEVRGFHEKLEGSDSWPESPSDCGTDEQCVISRQQIPLTGAKPSKYDDSHFKKFLKTQQKVNQMLERILATKNVRSGEVLR